MPVVQTKPAQNAVPYGRARPPKLPTPSAPPLPLPPPEPPPALLVAGAGVDPPTPVLASPALTQNATAPAAPTQQDSYRQCRHITESTPLIQRPRRATANYSTEIYARNGQGPRVADSTNRRKVDQYHESVSEADLGEQLRSRDEQGANGRQAVCTEKEDETDDQRMEEELDDETVGGETEDEVDNGGDDDHEDDERNEEEDDEMDEEELDGKQRDEADEYVDRKKSAVYLQVLLSRPDCLGVYDDSHFAVLCRARYVQQLKVLEAVCIRIHKPVLCKQKEHVVALRLYS